MQLPANVMDEFRELFGSVYEKVPLKRKLTVV